MPRAASLDDDGALRPLLEEWNEFGQPEAYASTAPFLRCPVPASIDLAVSKPIIVIPMAGFLPEVLMNPVSGHRSLGPSTLSHLHESQLASDRTSCRSPPPLRCGSGRTAAYWLMNRSGCAAGRRTLKRAVTAAVSAGGPKGHGQPGCCRS